MVNWSGGTFALLIAVKGTVAAGSTNSPASGAPTISGTAGVGETLTASTSGIMDSDGLTGVSYSYQWIRVDADGTSNPDDIAGATSSTYTLTADDAGHKLKVRVSFTDDAGNAEELTSAAHPTTGVVSWATLVSNEGQGGTRGDVDAGRTNAQSFTTGSNAAGYTLSEVGVDLGSVPTDAMMAVKLTGSSGDLPGPLVATFTSPASLTADAFNTFTAPSGIRLAPATTYWVVINEGIPTARQPELQSISGDGQTGEAGFTIGNDRHHQEHRQRPVDHQQLVAAHHRRGGRAPGGQRHGHGDRRGTAEVGETLTATVAGVTDPDGLTSPTYTHQWLRVDDDGSSNPFDIPGATSNTHTLTADDAGHKIRVRVSFSDDAGNAEELTSAAHPTSGVVVGLPGTPELTAHAAGERRILLNWTEPAYTGGLAITGYRIEWSPNGTTNWQDLVATTDSTATRYFDTLPAAGTTRHYRVSAINSQGTGAASNVDSATAAAAAVTLVESPRTNPFGSPRNRVLAQKFRTGSHPGGYTLSEVAVTFSDPASDSMASVRIRSRGGQTPGATVVATLTSPATFPHGQPATFTAPANTRLDPDTTYWVTVNEGVDDAHRMKAFFTGSDSEAGLPGWSISNDALQQSGGSWASVSNTLIMTLSGVANTVRNATGTVTIAGTAEVGEELTATVSNVTDTDGLSNATYSYQWIRVDADGTSNPTDITGATSSTHTLTAADAGKKVQARVSFNDNAGNTETLTSAAHPTTGVVRVAPNSPATGAPTISGTAEVGETLTASTSGITDTDGLTSVSYTYQWIRVDADGTSNPTDITGATSSTYEPVGDDVGHKLKVQVSFSDDAGNAEELTSAAHPTTGVVVGPPGAPAELTAHAVGTLRIELNWTEPANTGGLPITGHKIEWSANGTSNWADLVPNTDSTATRHFDTLPSDGTTRHYRVSAINSQGTGPASNVANATAIASEVVTLVASTRAATFASDADRILAQQFSTGSNPGGYTLSDVRLRFAETASDSMASVRIRSGGGQTPGSTDSTVVATLTSPATFSTSRPSVFTAPANTRLEANTTYWVTVNEGVDGAVRMKAAFTDSDDETGLPGWSVRNDALTRAGSWASVSNTLLMTLRGVALPVRNAAGAPSISGTAAVGEELTASTSGITDADGLSNAVYSYQWVRVDADGTSNPDDIPSATSSTYTLAAADGGKKVKVRVSFNDNAGNTEELTSDAHPTSGTVRAANNPASGAPTISGTAETGETLTASTSGITDTDGLTSVSYTYQWMRVDSDGTSNPDDITGAMSSTYTLTADDAGHKLKVRVSFTDDAGNPETLTSAAHPTTGTVSWTTLVSNTGQSILSGGSAGFEAQRFRTGANSDGYTLSEIQVHLADIAAGDRTTVTLRENSSGVPGDLVATLTNPASFGAGALNTFTAPAGTTLEASTRYWVTMNEDIPRINRILLSRASGSGQTGEPGFTISDDRILRLDDGTWITSSAPLLIAVRGAVGATNSPASGAPTISGTAEVGEELTASTSGIMDDDGLSGVSYTYQWVRLDSDGASNRVVIAGATSSTYTLTADDAGHKLKVRVSFTDEAGNDEILTSAAYPTTGVVPVPTPGAPTALGASPVATMSGVLGIDLSWTEPADNGGADIEGYRIEWSPNGSTNWQDVIADTGDTATTYSDTGTGATGLAPNTARHYRVSAINSAGTGTASVVADATTHQRIVLDIEFATYTRTEETRFVDVCALVASHSGGAPWRLTAYLATEDGTATTPADYSEHTGTALVFQVNDLSVCARVIFTDDDVVEDDETFFVNLSVPGAGAGFTSDTARSEVTITDGDTAQVSLVGPPSTAAEGTSATFVVSLVPTAGFDVTVNYEATGGTATSGTDYTATSGTLTFPAASTPDPAGTQLSFDVPILTDSAAEDPDETFEIRLSLPAGQAHDDRVSVPATAHTVTILDATNSPATGSPTIGGTAAVGQTLTASTSGITDSDGLTGVSYTYQWIRVDADATSNPTDITGATSSTYTLTAADVGKRLKVRVSFSDDAGNAEELTSAAHPTTGVVSGPPGAPTALGATALGGRRILLRWTEPANNGAPITAYRIEWSANGTSNWEELVATTNSTATTYSDTVPSGGATRHYRVSAINAAGTGPVSNVDSATATASVTLLTNREESFPRFGLDQLAEQFLTGTNPGGYLLSEVEIGLGSVQNRTATVKLRNLEVISGGRHVPGSLIATLANPPTLRSNQANTFTAPQNTRLRPNTWYWVTMNEGVAGGDRARIQVTTSHDETSIDAGWSLWNHVRFKDNDSVSWRSSDRDSDLSVNIALNGAALPVSNATGTVTVTGTATVREELTATVSNVTDTDGLTNATYSHQWVRVDADGTSNPVDIAGATSTTYTLAAADDGKKVRMRVRFNDDSGNPETLTSDAYPATGTVRAIAPGAPTALGATATASDSGVLGIDLSWTEPAVPGGQITGYHIEWSADGSTNWADVTADTGDDATTYRDTGTGTTGLAPETTRHYRVSAINSGGTGPPSTVDSATTAAKVTIGIQHATYTTTEETGFVDICAVVTSPSGGAPFEVEVYLTTEDGTATAPADYTPFTGRGLSLSINALNACAQIFVINDDLPEDDETLSVRLSVDGAGAGLGFGTERTEVTITDEDTAQVSLQGPSTVAEGTAATFVVSLVPAAAFDVTVEYAATGGTAIAGTDYTATSGTLTFPAASTPSGTARSFEVPILADEAGDPDKTFEIRLSLPSDQAHADRITMPAADHTVTITDSQPSKPGSPEATAVGAQRIDLTWSTPASMGAAQVTGYRIEWSADGNTNWADLVADTASTGTTHTDTMSLSAQTTRHYRVSAISSEGTGPPSDVATATTTRRAIIGFTQTTETQLEEGGRITVCIEALDDDRRPAVPVTVSWATSDGSAIAGEDYRAGSGTMVFNPTLIDCVQVVIVNDRELEDSPEIFYVNLTAEDPGEVEANPSRLTVEIYEEDRARVRLHGPAGVAEGGRARFEVSLVPTAPFDVRVRYETVDGTATAGADFTATSGTLTFPGTSTFNSGGTRLSFEVPILPDAVRDPDETFEVQLSLVEAGRQIELEDADASLTARIIDGLQPPAGLAAVPG